MRLNSSNTRYTAISRKVVAKSARDNHEGYCGWFWVRCSSKKFERMAQQAVDVCLRVLEESNKRRFDNYTVRNSVLIISHITSRDCRVHIFADNLSRNSCICETNRGIQVASFKVWSLSSHCSKSSSIPQKNYFFFKRVMQTRVNSGTITNLPYLSLNDASSRRISCSFAHNHSESPYPL